VHVQYYYEKLFYIHRVKKYLRRKEILGHYFKKKERKRNLHKLHDDIYHNIVWFQPAAIAIPFHDVLAQPAWHVGDW